MCACCSLRLAVGHVRSTRRIINDPIMFPRRVMTGGFSPDECLLHAKVNRLIFFLSEDQIREELLLLLAQVPRLLLVQVLLLLVLVLLLVRSSAHAADEVIIIC